MGFHALMRLTPRRIRRAMVEWPADTPLRGHITQRPVGETASVISPALRQRNMPPAAGGAAAAPIGVYLARCRHRLMRVTTLHESPPSRICSSCARWSTR